MSNELKTYMDLVIEIDKKSKINESELFKTLKKFWVFVPNPDEVSKSNNYVGRFDANSEGADLSCYRIRSYSNADLGVFLIKKIGKKK